MGIIIIGIIIWLSCGVIAHGLMFAYWNRKYAPRTNKEYRRDMIDGVINIIGGVSALIAAIFFLMNMGFRGFKLK